MNIFFLDLDPQKAAQAHCDAHVVKMILESAQLLSTAHRVLDGPRGADHLGLYRATHINHGCARWVRDNSANYRWTWQLMVHLLLEFKYRYDHHHSTGRLAYFLRYLPARIELGSINLPYLAMPDDCKEIKTPGGFLGCMMCYREYYLRYKRGGKLGTWTRREPPEWWK